MHAIEFVTSQPWLITNEALENIVSIAQRTNDVDGLDLQALAAKRGRLLDGSRRVQMRGATAIIPVVGPIFRYANMFTEISGATSTQLLATDFRAALDDPNVQSIILDINSPGGTASGINELGDMIFAARGEKPIIAYAGGEIASAAYWLGSAADEIVIDRTGLAGSIGAAVTFSDTSARDARAGVRTVEIVSSQSPDKRIDVNQDEGRAKVQKIVDDLAGVFVEAVARNRGVSVETVLSDFGQGGLMIGNTAVEAGLADRTGSLEAVLLELEAAHQPAHAIDNRRVFFMSTATKTKAAAKGPITVSNTAELHAAIAAGHTTEEISIESAVNVEEIRTEAHAAGVAEATAANEQAIIAARAEAVTTERARVTGLQGIAVKGFEDVVTKAMASGTTVEATAVAITQAQRSRGSVATLQGDAPAAVAHGGQGDAAAAAAKPWGKITAKQNDRIKRKTAGARR